MTLKQYKNKNDRGRAAVSVLWYVSTLPVNTGSFDIHLYLINQNRFLLSKTSHWELFGVTVQNKSAFENLFSCKKVLELSQ